MAKKSKNIQKKKNLQEQQNQKQEQQNQKQEQQNQKQEQQNQKQEQQNQKQEQQNQKQEQQNQKQNQEQLNHIKRQKVSIIFAYVLLFIILLMSVLFSYHLVIQKRVISRELISSLNKTEELQENNKQLMKQIQDEQVALIHIKSTMKEKELSFQKELETVRQSEQKTQELANELQQNKAELTEKVQLLNQQLLEKQVDNKELQGQRDWLAQQLAKIQSQNSMLQIYRIRYSEQLKQLYSQKKEQPLFSFIGVHKYECAGITNEVKEYKHNATGMEFVLIPGGTFEMGSAEGEKNEVPVHTVSVKSFLMAKYPCTQAQWVAVMKSKPWQGELLEQRKQWYKTYYGFNLGTYTEDNDNNPATWIDWNECQEFCSYTGLSLPTEEQWEYACRAGSSMPYCFGKEVEKLGEYAWYMDNTWDKGEQYAHAVGQKLPNAFGLYDMHGNIWEWCQNEYYENYKSIDLPKTNTTFSLSSHVIRGGCFYSKAFDARSSSRTNCAAFNANRHLGVRFCADFE